MFAIETENDYGQTVIDVFVSDRELMGIVKAIPIEKLTDKINDIIGMECIGFARTLVSDSSWAFAKSGYILRCRNHVSSSNTPGDVRRIVGAVLDEIKEGRYENEI